MNIPRLPANKAKPCILQRSIGYGWQDFNMFTSRAGAEKSLKEARKLIPGKWRIIYVHIDGIKIAK